MLLNKPQLSGIDNSGYFWQRYEFVSHFEEMRKTQSLFNDYLYLSITGHIRKFIKGPEGESYKGALHDGLVYDLSNDTIVEKIEFKSKENLEFGIGSINKLIRKYEPLGVDRIDLCHGNLDSYKKIVLQINNREQDLSSVKFKAKEFSEFLDEKINNDAYRRDVIDKQIELKLFIVDVQCRLLTDPDFFKQDSTNEINLKLFESIFACNLNL